MKCEANLTGQNSRYSRVSVIRSNIMKYNIMNLMKVYYKVLLRKSSFGASV